MNIGFAMMIVGSAALFIHAAVFKDATSLLLGLASLFFIWDAVS